MSQPLEFYGGVPAEVPLAPQGALVAGAWKDAVILRDGQTMFPDAAAVSVNGIGIDPSEGFVAEVAAAGHSSLLHIPGAHAEGPALGHPVPL
jgi:hypothetical protein